MNSSFSGETGPVFELREMPSLVQGVPDGVLALMAPIVAYWVYSGFFYVIDTFELCEKYRIHPPEEVVSRNKATHLEVLKDVLLQHVVQTVAGLILLQFDPVQYTGDEEYHAWLLHKRYGVLPLGAWHVLYCYGLSVLKILVAFVIIDSWQYCLHRYMHMNKYLYKRFHSRHHRLYVPYAYGALYNDPVEGFCLDTVGTGVAAILTQLTHRESLILFTFSTLKTVDDHCGYALPFDPFQLIFPNNSIYHDIHHQQFGIKTNFSQPFFTFWDVLFNTRYADLDKYKEHQRKVTITKYKQFLKDRQAAKKTKMAGDVYKKD